MIPVEFEMHYCSQGLLESQSRAMWRTTASNGVVWAPIVLGSRTKEEG